MRGRLLTVHSNDTLVTGNLCTSLCLCLHSLLVELLLHVNHDVGLCKRKSKWWKRHHCYPPKLLSSKGVHRIHRKQWVGRPVTGRVLDTQQKRLGAARPIGPAALGGMKDQVVEKVCSVQGKMITKERNRKEPWPQHPLQSQLPPPKWSTFFSLDPTSESFLQLPILRYAGDQTYVTHIASREPSITKLEQVLRILSSNGS